MCVSLASFLCYEANVWYPSPQFLRAVVFGDGHLWKATWVRWVVSTSIDFAISDFPVSYEEYMNVLWVTKDLSWQPKADYINISSFRKLASKNIALVPICAMTGIRWEVRGDNVTLLHPLSLYSLPRQVCSTYPVLNSARWLSSSQTQQWLFHGPIQEPLNFIPKWNIFK